MWRVCIFGNETIQCRRRRKILHENGISCSNGVNSVSKVSVRTEKKKKHISICNEFQFCLFLFVVWSECGPFVAKQRSHCSSVSSSRAELMRIHCNNSSASLWYYFMNLMDMIMVSNFTWLRSTSRNKPEKERNNCRIHTSNEKRLFTRARATDCTSIKKW